MDLVMRLTERVARLEVHRERDWEAMADKRQALDETIVSLSARTRSIRRATNIALGLGMSSMGLVLNLKLEEVISLVVAVVKLLSTLP